MKWYDILLKFIDKLGITKIVISAVIVVMFMLVPKINFLHTLMPLDDSSKIIKFLFLVATVYLILTFLIFIYTKITRYFCTKPRRVFRMWYNYAEYISIYFSEETNEYSGVSYNLERKNIPKAVIDKLWENNIIEFTDFMGSYRLTKKARKKLNRIRKTILFIDRRIMKRKAQEEIDNGQA